MRRHPTILAALALVAALGCAVERTRYGAEPKLSNVEPLPVAKLLAEPAQYDGQFVRVSGPVTDVCAKMGCWMRIGEADKTLFIKFTCPVEGRLIPMDAIGQTATVEGTVKVTQVSESEARHYAEDGGASPEAVAKIVGPQTEVTLQSPSAELARG